VEPFGAVSGIAVIRNSGDPDGPAVSFTRQEWDAFLAGVKAGDFDDHD
jgi:hypothetical protein